MKLPLLFFLFGLGQILQAQKQTHVWYFGDTLGLDFNFNPPELIRSGKISGNNLETRESVSTISDEFGNLLFYTDGTTVFNREHKVMSNGEELWGSGTTTQTLIVPKPGNSPFYYIFTASPQGDDSFFPVQKKGFRYTLVDLTLDGGLGAVTEKNVLLATSTTEKIAGSLHANGEDIWVVMHEWKNNTFRSYLIDSNDLISTPVVSKVGSNHEKYRDLGGVFFGWDAIGQMKISPDGEKLALALHESSIVEIFDFNNATGKISNPITLRDIAEPSFPLYGIEFSPDSRLLYVSDELAFCYQIDLTKLPAENVTRLGNIPVVGSPNGLQLGPDGKVYVAQWPFQFIGVINSPDQVGVACNYVADAIPTVINGITYTCNLGLPNFISSYFLNKELYPPKPFVEMPNVFTPNADGFNDRFVPMNYYRVGQAILAIYNRWGQQVFETTNVPSGWSGEQFPDGVYYWELLYRGTDKLQYSQKGVVKLVH